MQEPLLVLIDGNAIVHRAYHAFLNTKTLTVSKTGEIVSAVYGFAQMLLKTVNDVKPTHWAIAFDTAAPTFRHEMFAEYKAHRPKTPDELVNQFGRVKELVAAFNIPVFEVEGFEADDVIGTLSRQASEQGVDSVIVTGDADTMQLVGPRVKVLYPKPRGSFSETRLYDEDTVFERYGVKPENITDLKGLVGDPSDNIPGVKGIGEKTAVKLIQQFGTLEEIYVHIEQVTPPRIKTLLRDQEGIARQSKQLATIVMNAPVQLDLDLCCTSSFDRKRVTELFREMEFYSLLARLPETEGGGEETQKAVEIPRAYTIINTPDALDNLVKLLREAKTFAFNVETTGLDAMAVQLVGISISIAPGGAYYIPVGHTGWGGLLQMPLEQVISRIRPIMEEAGYYRVGHNSKFVITVLAENGIVVRDVAFDTMVAAYLLNEKALSLKPLTFNRLGIELTAVNELIGDGRKQITMAEAGVEQVCEYACADVDMTLRLARMFDPELREQGLWSLFADVEMPLIPVLVHMERSGVLLDEALLYTMSQELGTRIRELEADIYKHVGHEFNISSPQQLSAVLFQEMKLTAGKKIKSGGYSTGAAILEELRGVHPVIDLVLDYRQLVKLKSTYLDALPILVKKKTGRVHTNFNQTKTATGRLSSTDPNLQNIPVRGELGKRIRRAFIVAPGNTLLAGDYSQIDLRALAHLSQDPRLLEAFNRDEDIHAATASQIFGVEAGAVTPEMRRLAKTVNFGVIYGMSEYGLEQATELSREEAGKFIEAYFEKYSGVKQYLESTKQFAREKGYVQTLLGRKRRIPEINSANRLVREGAERMAINMPVQGTSADIIKVAMVNIYRKMVKLGLRTKMLLLVHDELLFEVPDDELDLMSRLVPESMNTAVKLSVPLKVDLKKGHNWGELE
ncbi:MAG: DNA polymerase I [Dehalococcoidales bacterium]|nr:DNA polymerase I [Dehalococcoidales bacterium]